MTKSSPPRNSIWLLPSLYQKHSHITPPVLTIVIYKANSFLKVKKGNKKKSLVPSVIEKEKRGNKRDRERQTERRPEIEGWGRKGGGKG